MSEVPWLVRQQNISAGSAVAGGVISILLPFRNAAATLPEALSSIEAQSFEGWELVAVDDGSTDDSRALLESFAARDRRVRSISAASPGLVTALNEGLQQCRYPLVARFDADDEMHCERLAAQYSWMIERPANHVAGTLVEIVASEPVSDGTREYLRWLNGCLTPDDISRNRYVESPLAHPSVMFVRDTVLDAGGYASGDFPEDYELWLRLLDRGVRISKVPRVLLGWRDTPERASRTDPRYRRDSFDALRAEYLARDPRITGERPLVIWGAGRRTRQRVAHLLRRGADPAAWIDIDPRKIGRSINDRTVHPPEWLLPTSAVERPFVLVYVASHGAREEIGGFLENKGYHCGHDWLAVG